MLCDMSLKWLSMCACSRLKHDDSQQKPFHKNLAQAHAGVCAGQWTQDVHREPAKCVHAAGLCDHPGDIHHQKALQKKLSA